MKAFKIKSKYYLLDFIFFCGCAYEIYEVNKLCVLFLTQPIIPLIVPEAHHYHCVVDP